LIFFYNNLSFRNIARKIILTTAFLRPFEVSSARIELKKEWEGDQKISIVKLRTIKQGDPMPKGYHQLNYESRCRISILISTENKPSYFARALNINRSTIRRELKRSKEEGKGLSA
jgi:hypothetical protein